MNTAMKPAWRVIALGRFGAEIPPLASHLAALAVEPVRCAGPGQLPLPLGPRDILLTELEWLNGLDAAGRAALGRHAAEAAAWIALSGRNVRFKEQVDWQRSGVSDFFTLPLAPDRLATLVEDLHDRLDGPPLRVILLDDEQSALDYYGSVLRERGLEVQAVQDPLLALDLLDEFRPDLLLADIEMPGCRGPELVTILRQRPEHAHLPVLFLTAMDSLQDLLQARAAAAEDFLPKPVAPALLLTAVCAQGWRHRARLRAETEHQRQEARARLRLEQLRMAVDEHAIVSATDVTGRISYANDKFCTLSGYRREELLGQNHSMVKSGLHPAGFYENLWGTITAGKVWHGEVCNRRKDGALYWVEATIVPILDTRGRVTQYLSIRTDITAQKQKEEYFQVMSERLRRGQIFANIGTWDWNIQTGELYWSERIAPLFGHPAGDLETSYENFLNSVHPDDRQAVIDAVNASVERDQPYEIEHRVVWPDGQVRWLLERGAVMRDEQGKPQHMLGVVQDIHERKLAQLALVESERRLRESEKRLALAVEGPGDGIWDWNMLTGEMPLSGNYEGMLGFARGELEPSIEAWVQSVHPDDLARVQQALQDYLTGKTPAYTVELRLRCKDGGYKWILCRGTVVARNEAGVPVRMIGIHSDISEEQARREELAQAKEAAERANQAKSDFLSSMSHELRTPMNAIIGFAQMLEYDAGLNNDQHDNVHEILKAGRHLLDLINEVLDLAKIESGRIDLSLEPVSLSAVIDDCRQLIQPLAAAREIGLQCDLPAGKTVRADRVRLKQVLLNLLSNAVKYNRERGSIRLDATAGTAGHLRIAVTDTGPGIPAERLGELFQPFNRLDAEQSEIEGTGIGLTITRRLVEMMGGEVGVASEVGKGSSFWIELPADEQSARIEVAESAGKTAAGPAQEHQLQVLCVDDNPVNLKLIAHMLGRRPNLRVITAHTPELGIELALAHRPELILLDINMPGMDGYQVLEVFKADPRLQRIPVVAVTASAMPRDIERGKAAGFRDYLTKPLDIGLFLDTIDRCLPGREKPT